MLLDDLAAPFSPGLGLPSLSRAALAVLGREWLLSGHLQDRVGMPFVLQLGDRDEMLQVSIDEWMMTSPVYTRRAQRALRFAGTDVGTICKGIQLDIGAPHRFLDFRFTVHDPQHAEFTLPHCGALMDVEPMGEDYVHGMCHTIEDPTFDATAVATNPRARVRPVHRPPRVPADRSPHCHWTIEIDESWDPVRPHAALDLVAGSLAASATLTVPDADAEAGGRADYSGPFDPDFELEDLSHRTLVLVLGEVALQCHLLLRGFLLAVADRFGAEHAAPMAPAIVVGQAGLAAQRLVKAMRIDGGDADAIARLLSVHPALAPRGYLDTTVELVGDHVRLGFLDCPAFHEPDGLAWVQQLAGEADRVLEVIAQAVDARAVSTPTRIRDGEVHAYDLTIDPDRAPAREAREVTLAKFSTGATFELAVRRPVRA